MELNHMLVIMDPTIDRQPALAKAIELAKGCSASIELLLVVHDDTLVNKWLAQKIPQAQIIANFLQTKQRWLDTYVEEVVLEKIEVSSEVRWHTPLFEEVIKKVEQCNADIVIKSTHPHPTMNKLLFSPNDWQLLKSCPVPLLLAKEKTTQSYGNIMAALDLKKNDQGQNLDDMILETTMMLAERLKATPHVAHCFDPMGYELWQNAGLGTFGYAMPSYDYQAYEHQLQESHQQELKHLIENYAVAPANCHLESGIAHYQLLDIVNSHDIDLLVMGMRAHSGFIGNTAEKILDDIKCDILTVKVNT